MRWWSLWNHLAREKSPGPAAGSGEGDELPPLCWADPSAVPKLARPGLGVAVRWHQDPPEQAWGQTGAHSKSGVERYPEGTDKQNKSLGPWSQGQARFIPMVLPLWPAPWELPAHGGWATSGRHLWLGHPTQGVPMGWECLWPLLCTSQASELCS